MPLRKPKNVEMLVDPDIYQSPVGTVDGLDPKFQKLIDDHLAHRVRLGGHITYRLDDGTPVIKDNAGVRPFPDGSVAPTPPDSAELKIRELAFRNGIHASRDGLDDWADTVTRLADDDVDFDEVQELIVAMRKAKVEDGIELTKLHARYLEERSA